MSDVPGGAPRPPRPPVNAAEAGAWSQRPQQALLHQATAGPGIGTAVATTRQMVIGVSPSNSPRLSNVGTRLVGTSTPRLLLSVDQQPATTSQWISVAPTTTAPRRQVTTPVTSTVTSASLLRPVAAFSTPSPTKRHSSPTTSTTTTSTTAARKRLKLDPEEPEEVPALRRRLLAHKATQLHDTKDIYTELLAELFFLQAGGNMMDYLAWRKRPPNPQYTDFIRTRRLDDDESELERLGVTAELRVTGPGTTPVALSKQLPAVVAQLNQQGGVPLVPAISGPVMPTTNIATSSPASRAGTFSTRAGPSVQGAPKHVTQRLPLVPAARLHTRQHSISAVYDTSLGSQEQIVEKAKQEAYIMQRVTELQRDGLWSEKRLPKVQEPSRAKAHWDYLLEEMVWLAADFAQERKWKKAAAKKCARMVQKYFQDKAVQAQKAEKSQELRIRKIASCIAKEIKTFWNNAHKLVEYKHHTMLEERRRQALDQHLSYIVDQTEKYSSWLAESMGSKAPQSRPESTSNSLAQSRSTPEQRSDGDFDPNESSSDDEETIAMAEADDVQEEQSEEVKLLELESTLPLDDVIKSLPAEVRESLRQGTSQPSTSDGRTEQDQELKADDDDFAASEEDSSDDEETIQEQEKTEGEVVDHKKELDELAEDNTLSVEELLAKYNQPADGSAQPSDDEEEDEDEESESSEEEESSEESTEEDVDLSSLLEDGKGFRDINQLCDSVEEYQEYQPTGNTLSSTKVETKVPFLLKHELREYQHVGLEWLVTMYNKRLNGILADEMGLGKTIQTIALLAHLACDKCIWGPHLIVVPTSVMLNWEMEFKKWCPAFKILTYYGSQKERRLKRTGWTKPNAFHVCITSYKLVIQDHQSFRRKKWRYLILDEAQNIKNFRSQRWQLLMNFQSQRRLLLTGTPLQNNLMELWSLMHFLMPDVFQSHKEFKEWFVNPVTGMIEGNSEYNDKIIKRLHKVLRPFLLRRLKTEVERQLPKKYEHVVMCRLSKRQRFLYDDFMSRAKTRETLATGNLLSVINVLMQLRKVCNHPNLFEVRPTISPFQMESLNYYVPSLVCYALDYDVNKHVSLNALNLRILDLEYSLAAYTSHRISKYHTPRRLIEEIDSQPLPPPAVPKGKLRLNVKAAPQTTVPALHLRPGLIQVPVGTSPVVRALTGQATGGQGVMLRVTGGSPVQGYSVQLVQHPEGVRAIPVATLASAAPSGTPAAPVSAATIAPTITSSPVPVVTQTTSVVTAPVRTPVTTGSQPTDANATVLQRVQRSAGFAQLVQTATGKHILLTSSPQPIIHTPTAAAPTANTTVLTTGGQRLTVLSKPAAGVITSTITPLNKVLPPHTLPSTSNPVNRPVGRVPPLNVTTVAPTQTTVVTPRPPFVATSLAARPTLTLASSPTITTRILDPRVIAMAESIKKNKEQPQQPKSIFHLAELEEARKRDRKEKLACLANINERRCEARPLYGGDLLSELNMMDSPAPSSSLFSSFPWAGGAGLVHCLDVQRVPAYKRLETSTEALEAAIFSYEQRVNQLRDIFSRFVMYVPSVNAPRPRLHASHPSPSRVWAERQLEESLAKELAPRAHLLHPVSSGMATQFPDPRLIQYDCGKLQVMEKLLRDLKAGNHRVLIFTQMTRMLDVLEAFLNHQGHIYLRLDGATKVDQRQVLMERFNADKRIFVFILSTRSGGIGVNLTGADTVVFYDSDWNPTMDAQAQDRCHRIGQTRDVHIYRLVSEMTVEENILKKANQKRLLGDLAIEGGNFTTAYFKSSTIQELFNIDVKENNSQIRLAEVLASSAEHEKQQQRSVRDKDESEGAPNDALNNLENVLAAAEDETDVQAARTARAEAAAELAEFDETIALDDDASPAQPPPGEELSKAEQELQNIIEKLSPIERYAMKMVEESESAWTAEQFAAAEAEIEHQKREWEMGRLRALQEQQREQEEEEELKQAENQSSNLITYSGRDAHSQVNTTGRGRGRPSKTQKGRNVARGVKQKLSATTDKVQENGVDSSSGSESDKEEEDQSTEEEESSDDSDSESSSDASESPNNCVDPNSPRTRSRGTVKINLWTLDVSPILPGLKPIRPPSVRATKGGKTVLSVATPNCVKKKESEVEEMDVDGPESSPPAIRVAPAKATYTRAKRRSDCTDGLG